MCANQRRQLVSMIGVYLLAIAGCGFSFELDPATRVTITIRGQLTDEKRELIAEQLIELTDGGSRSMSSTYSGDVFTISVAPVSDVERFIENVDFGSVERIGERQFTVTLEE